MRYPKASRLLKRREFERLMRQGKRRSGKWLQIEYREASSAQNRRCRLGITVTKKFGKAHERNRFKRLVRESFRTLPNEWSAAFEIVVRPRGSLAGAGFLEVASDLKEILQANGLLKNSCQSQS